MRVLPWLAQEFPEGEEDDRECDSKDGNDDRNRAVTSLFRSLRLHEPSCFSQKRCTIDSQNMEIKRSASFVQGTLWMLETEHL